MSETGSDIRSGIGARLRAGREKMGLTLLQVAEKLHVDAKVVESLEGERFDALGAPVFVRGHLKHYAELIGEPAGQLLELYAAATTQPAMPDLRRVPKAAPDTRPSRLAVPALVVLIGFVLLGVVWWLVQSIGHSGGESAPRKSAAQPVTIEPEAASNSIPSETDVDAMDAASAASDANRSAPAAGGNAGRAAAVNANGAKAPIGAAANSATPPASDAGRRASGPPPRATATTNPAAPGAQVAQSTSSAPAANPSASGATATAGTPAPARGKPMQVTLKFAADSWVEVYDASGAKLFYDIGSADSSHTISGTPPFRVTFGNAPGVTFDVNGKPATVPANAMKDDAAQFVINRSGSIVRARPLANGG